ncbi:putative F-box protein At1g65770 [Syzygium oleosum]|uniref:putative F-box protein At1g65770 n=1 Tax=Syzygium oleosum TaxID=219896 RepID=UPI0011D249F4|nr:putative F-box protein At1g65770 [Syzygium oleosum]
MERSVPWSELPPELLSMIWSMIRKKLDTDMDVVRCRSVCSSWRSSIPPVSELELRIGGDPICQRRVYLLEPPPPTSPEDESRCPPSREGWLIKIAEDDEDDHLSGRGGRVRLFNPLSSRPILFKGGTFPKVLCTLDYRVTEIFVERCLIGENRGSYYGRARKVIMLPDSPRAVLEEALVVGIFGKGKLACWKHGDEHWHAMGDSSCQYDDVIAYKGQFYAVDRFGIVWWIDPSFEIVQYSLPVCSDGNGGDRNYLVESGGDLYVVDRYLDESQFSGIRAGAVRKAADFKVYRLNQDWGKWDEIRSLGDVALFLGNHSCFSVSVKGFGGCKGNCIYFTVFDETPGGKVKVFDMEDRSIKRASDSPARLRILWPPPAWIAPNGVALSPYSLKEPLF